MFKFFKRKKFKKEFESKCLHTRPCQCCAYYRIRGRYEVPCELKDKLLKKHGLEDKDINY